MFFRSQFSTSFFCGNPLSFNCAMPKTSLAKAFTVLTTLWFFLFVSCTPKTDEDRIRGRDKSETQNMVQTYFREFRGIVIHVLGT